MSINQAPVLTTGNANGVVKQDFGSYNVHAPHVVLQADGKIVVNGYGVAPSAVDIRSELIRYNADGSLDTTFGSGGIVTSGLFATRTADVAMQADGKIVVADADYAVTRYNSDGSLDTSFGTGGTAATRLDYFASGVLVQADGKIVVSGSDFELARYDSNGNLDQTFGVGGKVTTGFGGQGFSLAGQPDGKLIVAGDIFAGGHTGFAVARYNSDGSLDASFGAGGEVSTIFGPANTNSAGSSVTLQADGKIVVAGASDFSKNLALVRYNVDGSLDASFGSGGMVTTSVPNGSGEEAKSVKIQPDGKIVVAGYSFVLGSNSDFVLVRYNSDGSLDSSFGTGGKVATELGWRSDTANSIVLLPDGKILVVGTTGDGPVGSASNQPGLDFALARYNSDGSLDTSFGAATALNGSAFFIEDTIPSVLNARATVHDAELDAANSYAGASLTLVRHGGANAEDVFGASGHLAALTQGGDITLSGTAIGTVTQNSAGMLVLTFGAAATEARVDEAMRAITYTNTSENPAASAQIDWSFSDGNSGAQGSGGALSATGSTALVMTAVNDAPVNTVPGPLNAPAEVDYAIAGLSVSDTDSTSVDVVFRMQHGTLTLAPAGAAEVFGNGTGFVSVFGSIADVNAVLGSAIYHSAAGFIGVDTMRMETDDFDGSGIPGSDSDTITLNVAAVAGSLSINDVTLTEGNNGSHVAAFTVTRSQGTAAFDVSFGTADGTATTAGHDYVANAGTLHFDAGVHTQTVEVAVNGDARFEADENFSVDLSGATNGAAISDGHGTGIITNDDALFGASTFNFANFAPGAGGWDNDNTYPRELADVNGDGMADIVGFGYGGVSVALATGDGSFGPVTFELAAFAPGAGGWDSNHTYPRELADVNGDGMADIVGFGYGGVSVALATGGGAFGPVTFELAAFAPGAGGWDSNDAYPRQLADVNGDGMADIVGFGYGGVSVALATGGGSFGPVSFQLAAFAPGAGGWTSNDAYPRELADVNGDHMADIVGFGYGGVSVALATGGGSFGPVSLKLEAFAPGAGGWNSNDQFPRELADVNGDGMADIIGFAHAGTSVALATGGGSFGPASLQLAAFADGAGGWDSNDAYPRHLADINHDGAADIIGFGYDGVHEALSHAFLLI